MTAARMPTALTIAGSDSGGGAGIQADLKTFTAFRVVGLSVITGLTAQNTRGVRGVELPTIDFIAAQLRAVLEDIGVDAVKTGMLATGDIIRTVAGVVRELGLTNLVVDPVMMIRPSRAETARDRSRAGCRFFATPAGYEGDSDLNSA